jgi:hypothetical protein
MNQRQMCSHGLYWVLTHRLRWLVILGLAVVGGACTTSNPESASRGAGLLQDLRQAFAKMNSRIAYVYVLEVRQNPSVERGVEYVLLATAGAPNVGPKIDFANELFGVFVADSTLGHVKRVLDVFPTRRWHDYSLRFELSAEGVLEVVGSGESLGDQPMRRVYDWSPSAGGKFLIREYIAPKDTAGTWGE